MIAKPAVEERTESGRLEDHNSQVRNEVLLAKENITLMEGKQGQISHLGCASKVLLMHPWHVKTI